MTGNQETLKKKVLKVWLEFKKKHPSLAQFLVFFIVCNGVTILQMILMPLFKWCFGYTWLLDISFEWLPVGHNLNGSVYYVFDYAAGTIAEGGGGGLAYFLAVELTMAIAQVINFVTQRNVTFQSKSNVWKAAGWYLFAYVIVTIGAAALQGLYKEPIYRFLMERCGSATGITLADFITMIINCAISFWVFFPIMKWIFKK